MDIKYGNYDYKDENGNVVGTIHKVDGDIKECKWGLHFSEEPHNCFSFYESLPWFKYAKVEAYGNVMKSKNGEKSIAQIIKIIETYSFDEFIKIIQEKLQSRGVSRSNGVSESFGVSGSFGLYQAIFCHKKSGRLYLFNKHCKEERFKEVYDKLLSFDWSPKFNNAEDLKGNLEWYETNIPAIVSVENKTAWSFMPEEMKAYIQSLPEYDEKIFKKVTE